MLTVVPFCLNCTAETLEVVFWYYILFLTSEYRSSLFCFSFFNSMLHYVLIHLRTILVEFQRLFFFFMTISFKPLIWLVSSTEYKHWGFHSLPLPSVCRDVTNSHRENNETQCLAYRPQKNERQSWPWVDSYAKHRSN